MDEYSSLIAPVAAAMRKVAAAEVLPRFGQLQADDISEKSGPHDLVTVADRAAEWALTPRLEAMLPGSVVIGEEAASADPAVLDRLGGAAPVWLVDPVDGTANFVSGSPRFGMMVALVIGDRTVAGWILMPVTDDMATVVAGQGAEWNGTCLTHPSARPFAAARVDYSARYVAEPYRSALTEKLTQTAEQRQGHCSAYAYVDLARGEIDLLVQYMMSPWDHAAGTLLVAEAGGASRFIDDGSAYTPVRRDPRLILSAANAAAWANYREALA